MTEYAGGRLLNLSEEIVFDYTSYVKNATRNSGSDELVKYYDLKYKICQIIKAESIFENDIGHGLNLLTFSHAFSSIRYIGLKRDFPQSEIELSLSDYYNASDVFNQIKILNQSEIKLEELFREQLFDLVYINGNLSGDQVYELLMWGLEKSKWICLDDYYLNTDIMMATNFFVRKYNDYIDFMQVFSIANGFALIQIKKNYVKGCNSYIVLESAYDKKYYLSNCGGYDVFTKSGGLELDLRLREVYQLVNPQAGDKILDVGCGRGELSYAIATSGAEVVGIDYSQEAIDIAKEFFCSKENLKLTFIKGDVMDFDKNHKFNRIIMADVYEHIDDASLIKLLSNLKEMLSYKGKLIIHTAPNREYYDSVYKEKIEQAKRLGLYLPRNPRTLYEDIMHINEQTPNLLRSTLLRWFDYVYIWTGGVNKIFNSVPDLESAFDNQIYAICSNQNDIGDYVESIKYLPIDISKINIEIKCEEKKVKISNQGNVEISITNFSNVSLASKEPYPVRLSYHIFDDNGNLVVYDGIRTDLITEINSNKKIFTPVNFTNHELNPGSYIYRITLVQENHCWFDAINQTYIDLNVDICE